MAKFREHFGLDIGSRSIKLVQLTPAANGKFRLVTAMQMEIPTGVDGPELETEKINLIKKLVSDSRATCRQVVVSLPESQVYTRVIEMPALPESELAQAIRWQAEQYIPVPLEDVVLKHQVISKTEAAGVTETGMTKILLVAAPNLLLKNFINILSHAGLEALAMETEILAVARALVGTDPQSPATMLVHIGSETTTLSVLVNGELALTQSISSGGLAVSRAISSALSLDINQAEEYKRSYGLDETKLEGKVGAAIKPIIELILTELRRAMAFYETHGGKEGIKRIVLSGGSALIPGLIHYMAESLGLEVQEGNPFLGVEMSAQQKQAIGENAVVYSTATGLALKPT